MPSLFTNEYSRGPLYQYWKERGAEEKALRDQRVQEARIRSKGFTPMDAAYGPSSRESYSNREERGPPGYEGEIPPATTGGGGSVVATASETGPVGDELPAYFDTTTSRAQNDPAGNGSGSEPLLSASEEKSRLQRLEEQNRQTQSDAAIAQSLSNDEALQGEGAEGEDGAYGNGKQPERKKSTVGKVGRWLADAATGYTKKQERW